MSQAVRGSIVDQPDGKNVTEWCKREECWNRIQALTIELPRNLETVLIQLEKPVNREANGPAAGVAPESLLRPPSEVTTIPAETWLKISRWARETGNLSPWQRSLAYSLGKLTSRGANPSDKQATQGVKILEEARRLGFTA